MHARAGQPSEPGEWIDVDALLAAYVDVRPDPADPAQHVAFGTSGHRGSALTGSFNETHILAITQAICDYRRQAQIGGPLFLGKDTHALSRPAEHTALEVLAANGIVVVRQRDDGVAPTPVISRAIVAHNRGRASDDAGRADGVVVTPSHNPPQDGGFKYNPPGGGPADTDITNWIQARANALIVAGLADVRRIDYAQACAATSTRDEDYVAPYLEALAEAIDFDAIRAAGIRIGIDPLGGSALPYVQALGDAYDIDVTVVNPALDPRFGFMTLDHDGKIRMDCSSPYAMASLIALKDDFDVAFGMDPDADRHGIVAPSCGLLNPNHYLAVAIRYLVGARSGWPAGARIGKTLVSSGILDRVAKHLGRTIYEVPVGFKWLAPGLGDASLLFGGEESAGASFLRKDGTTWTTDKDGILLGLLAAELTARTGEDPGVHYDEIADEIGRPCYRRVDRPATPEVKARLASLAPDDVESTSLAGEPILARLTAAPGNDAPIGGLKVVTENGWFAARPSGTEAIYKIYAESFRDEAHLEQILTEAGAIVAGA